MDFPTGNVITAITTIIAVVVGNRLSSKQSVDTKLWDLRRQAYGVILAELASVERICEVVCEHMLASHDEYFETDESTSHDKQIATHMGAVHQKFSDDYLILSNDFLVMFEVFLFDLHSGPPDEGLFSPVDAHKRFSAAVSKHRPLLLAQGRKEMAVQHGGRKYLSATTNLISAALSRLRRLAATTTSGPRR